jgi:Family of unknown function (DUF6518)
VTTTRASSPVRLRADSTVSHRSPIWLRAALVVAVGLAVGALTSFGQTYLGGALNAFVNSASAWLVAPFFLGAVMPTRRTAAAAGLTAALAQLLGYYATAHLRGYPTGGAIVAFWSACALMGGPLFGAGGHLWRNGGGLRFAGLGAALLPAAFLAEGLWVYLHELHYYATAALWIGIGLALAVLLPSGLIQRRWLPLTLVLGIAGEIAVSQIYRQTF